MTEAGRVETDLKCRCGGEVTYFGEALMGSLKCRECGDSLMVIGHAPIKDIYNKWEDGHRGLLEQSKPTTQR
jgi:hypothetical protein